jgi:Cu2+-exporting ATPase
MSHHKMMVEDFKQRFFISTAVTIPVLLLSPLVQDFLSIEVTFPGDSYVLFALSAFVYVYGGYPFTKGLYNEVTSRTPGMMTLIGLAISVAFFYSSAVVFGLPGKFFFWELVTLIDIMLLGHWVEMRSVMGASRALEELAKLMPSTAHKLEDDGSVNDVAISSLSVGDRVLVKPGEKVPSDGTIVDGKTSVNESLLTGESTPVAKGEGDEVIGASINGEGSITVEITHTGKDSYISQVISLVEQAQQSRSKTQNLADRAALWLTIISISVGIITFSAWYLAGRDAVFSIERMVTVMVITCPHALGLAIPLVVAVSISLSVKKGVLVRDRRAFEQMRLLDTIVFDKTGTLTKGEFGVTDIVALDGDEESLVYDAASLEARSEHPIGVGIVNKAREMSINPGEVSSFSSITGRGIEGTVDGTDLRVVSQYYVKEHGDMPDDPRIARLLEQGKTLAFVYRGRSLAGVLALADIIRPESRDAIASLQAEGLRCLMLTGDNEKVAAWVAEEVGLDDYIAEVLPEQKSNTIKKIQDEGHRVGMVGDGVNDAPALAQADVGIAIGAGTDVAIESADVILVQSEPTAALSSYLLSKATYSKMKQNLFWATGYNAVTIPLAAGVLYPLGILLSPAVGAVLMSLSTVIVAINARFLSADEPGKGKRRSS